MRDTNKLCHGHVTLCHALGQAEPVAGAVIEHGPQAARSITPHSPHLALDPSSTAEGGGGYVILKRIRGRSPQPGSFPELLVIPACARTRDEPPTLTAQAFQRFIFTPERMGRMSKNPPPGKHTKGNTLTIRDTKVNLFSVVASAMPDSSPEATDGDRRAEGHPSDQHLVEVPADLLRELSMNAQKSTETAIALRDWTVGVMLQLAEIARDGIDHLDRDEIEVARFVLAFIANVPTRMCIAPGGRHV